MHFDIQMISTPSGICKIDRSWNECVGTLGEAPFFFSPFVKQFMEFQSSTGWSPLVLVFSIGDQTVGMAPFIRKKLFGIPVVRFLHRPRHCPELIIHNSYRKEYLERTLDYLFRTLRCKLIDISLPSESPNIPLLRQLCKDISVHFSTRIVAEFGHCVLPITGDWNSFETSRGGNFRRKFRKMERKLSQVGSRAVVCVEDPNGNPDVMKKILNVEKASWKETWRRRKRDAVDPEISMLWKASQEIAGIKSDLTSKVWFLELDCRVIAYSVVFECNRIAFISKITYDEGYRTFYPGIYLINAIIQDSFKKGQIRKVDFQTDLPFMKTWAPTRMSRVRVMMGKGIPLTVLETMLNNDYFVKARREIMDPLLEKVPSISFGLGSMR